MLFKHVLRNSVIPVITYIGISFGALLGGAIITESIFNWDGVGLAMAVSIQSQNNPIIVGVATWGWASSWCSTWWWTCCTRCSTPESG